MCGNGEGEEGAGDWDCTLLLVLCRTNINQAVRYARKLNLLMLERDRGGLEEREGQWRDSSSGHLEEAQINRAALGMVGTGGLVIAEHIILSSSGAYYICISVAYTLKIQALSSRSGHLNAVFSSPALSSRMRQHIM